MVVALDFLSADWPQAQDKRISVFMVRILVVIPINLLLYAIGCLIFYLGFAFCT